MIEQLIIRLGAPAVGALIAVETVVPPVPSELVLPFAGFQAARGHLDPTAAWAAATSGSLVGAWLLYGLGAVIGRDRLAALAARRWFILFGPRDLERGERFFSRHGGAVVLFGRCIPLVRSIVSVPAGLERMPRRRFTFFTVLGSGIWNAAFIAAGWHLEDRWHMVERWMQPVALTVLALVLAIAGVTAVRKVRASTGD